MFFRFVLKCRWVPFFSFAFSSYSILIISYHTLAYYWSITSTLHHFPMSHKTGGWHTTLLFFYKHVWFVICIVEQLILKTVDYEIHLEHWRFVPPNQPKGCGVQFGCIFPFFSSCTHPYQYPLLRHSENSYFHCSDN